MSTQKYTKADVDQIIQEEVKRMLQKKRLQSRLQQINEELGVMNAEDKQLNEVQADGEEKVPSHAWTGERDGDVKFKPKFEKKGSHLLEDDMETGEFEAEFAKIGKAIDEKLKSMEGAEMGAGEMGAMDADKGEMGADKMGGDTMEGPEAGETNAEGGDDFEEIEIDDNGKGEENAEIKNVEAEKEPIEESGENTKKGLESIEGKSVVQVAGKNTFGAPYEEKADIKGEGKTVKEENKLAAAAPVITEGTASVKKNLITEGLDTNKKKAINEELQRMRKLTGFSADSNEE